MKRRPLLKLALAKFKMDLGAGAYNFAATRFRTHCVQTVADRLRLEKNLRRSWGLLGAVDELTVFSSIFCYDAEMFRPGILPLERQFEVALALLKTKSYELLFDQLEFTFDGLRVDDRLARLERAGLYLMHMVREAPKADLWGFTKLLAQTSGQSEQQILDGLFLKIRAQQEAAARVSVDILP